MNPLSYRSWRSLLSRRWYWLALFAFLAIATLVHRDFGITWDEGVQSAYGELVVEYFRSGFTDIRNIEFLDLRYYGPLVEAAFALVYEAGGYEKYATRHLLTAAIAALAIPGLGLLCQTSATARGLGLFAVIALFSQPRFIGHAFGNSKDLPFAVAFIWFVLATLQFFRPRGDTSLGIPWLRASSCGVAAGLALCARPGSLPLLVLFFALLAGLRAWLEPEVRRFIARRATLFGVALTWLLGWLIMVAPWPWAHQNPVANPIRAAFVSAQFDATYPVRFGGEVVSSSELPWHYLMTYLVIATPLLVLILALVGGLKTLVLAYRTKLWRKVDLDSSASGELLLPLVALVWVLVPVVGFVVVRPNVYDGLRHFLFLLPAVAVLAGFGASLLAQHLTRWLPNAAALVVALLLLLPLRDVLALHPYQYVFFNSLVGGVAGAQPNYETDYWAASYSEALLWIATEAEKQPNRNFVVLVDGSSYLRAVASQHRRENVAAMTIQDYAALGSEAPPANFWVVGTRAGWGQSFPASTTVHEVVRQGAVLSTVRALRP